MINPQYHYSDQHGVGEVTDINTGISTKCVLMNKGYKRAAQIAYLGARLSRSRDSIYDIIDSVSQNNVDSDSRIEKITVNYGHRSVGDMANINLFIDNVPMFTAMKLFYLIPALSGQENSTRYIDFSNYKYISPSINMSDSLTAEYHSIMKEMMELYDKAYVAYYDELRNYYKPQNKREEQALTARSLDCARHFIPMGITTNLFIQASATQWSIVISKLRSSIYFVDRTVGECLYQLLSGTEELEELGYVPEAPGLIRHADPNYKHRDMYQELLDQVKGYKEFTRKNLPALSGVMLYKSTVFSRLVKLFLDVDTLNEYSANSDIPFIQTMLKYCNRHTEMPALADFGQYNIRTFVDIGSLKDFNRHRSLERFIPYLEDEYRINRFLEFEPSAYHNALKLPLIDLLTEAQMLVNRISTLYTSILEEQKLDYVNPLTPSVCEWIKYLLPHGVKMNAEFGMSLKDISYVYDLRVRPGGHINYRLEVEKWAEILGVYNDLKAVNFERDQFYDRS